MDQRPNQLNDDDWFDDRTTRPRVEEQAMATADAVSDYDSETERIKADIEDTRAELGQTLNEIQERLSPEHVMDQVKETVREATIGKVERVMERVNDTISNVTEPAMEAMGSVGEKLKETGSAVTNTVRRNPIPLALIGLGVGMYLVNRYRSADERTSSRRYDANFEREYGYSTPPYQGMGRQYASRSGEYAGASRQYGASTLSNVKGTANEYAHSAAERVSELGHQAKEGALWASRGFQRMLNENPLAVGATAIAVGAAVGLVLPATRIEQEYMGEASERLVDNAKQAARDAMDKVKEATQGETGGGQSPQAGHSQPGQSQPGQSQHAGQPQPGQPQPGQPQAGHSQPGHSQHAGQPQPGQPQAGQSQSGRSQAGQSQSQPGQPQAGRATPRT